MVGTRKTSKNPSPQKIFIFIKKPIYPVSKALLLLFFPVSIGDNQRDAETDEKSGDEMNDLNDILMVMSVDCRRLDEAKFHFRANL